MMSLRMIAVMATLAGFPFSIIDLYFAAISSLKRMLAAHQFKLFFLDHQAISPRKNL